MGKVTSLDDWRMRKLLALVDPAEVMEWMLDSAQHRHAEAVMNYAKARMCGAPPAALDELAAYVRACRRALRPRTAKMTARAATTTGRGPCPARGPARR